jgi:hypothetical protein
MFSNGTKAAVLRKTSNNNYIYKAKDKTSYGYFTRWKSSFRKL